MLSGILATFVRESESPADKGDGVTVEMEELKRRQDALEEFVNQLEHRLTMDEYQLKCVTLMGPSQESASAEGADGNRQAESGTWRQGVDDMLRSIGLHQGFHENHLKDLKEEFKHLRARQDLRHVDAMASIEARFTAIKEGTERIERMVEDLAAGRAS